LEPATAANRDFRHDQRALHRRATRALRGRTERERSRALLPSGIGSAAPAHGSTHAVSPTACRFPPPMPDRSTTGNRNDSADGQKITTTHLLFAVRVNRASAGMKASNHGNHLTWKAGFRPG